MKHQGAAPGRSGGGVRHPASRRTLRLAAGLLWALSSWACDAADGPASPTPGPDPAAFDTIAFLDTLQARTFAFFWETTNPANGLVPDRWPDPPFASIAAVGFGLTAYPIGVERGWVTRSAAADRTLTTLRFFAEAQKRSGAGQHGFLYHFMGLESGLRHGASELSTIDTALLLAGVLVTRQYFDGADGVETEIRALADSIYRAVEWDWASPRPPLVALGWRPESGFLEWDWRGYNEAMLLYVLALGSPTHTIAPAAWTEWTSTYDWSSYYGQQHVNFAPLFGHQYSHVWIDFRGIQDGYMRGRGIDYFENSRRAVYAQRAYAANNPNAWTAYSEELWGLTASDGPGSFQHPVSGRIREFHGYWARGAAAGAVRDDGTLVPTAAGGSVPFAPEIAIPALVEMQRQFGFHLLGEYGFFDAFNPSLTDESAPITKGRIVPGVGWFDSDYLGIDQGPILIMIENHRTGLIWELMRESPYVIRGLCRAGFTGGWLGGRC